VSEKEENGNSKVEPDSAAKEAGTASGVTTTPVNDAKEVVPAEVAVPVPSVVDQDGGSGTRGCVSPDDGHISAVPL
jgi:hypothetical protein